MKVVTTPTQLLEGFPVGPHDTTTCQHCEYRLYEGDRVTVLASRPADTDRWAIYRPYCVACSPDTITEPTRGCTELLAECRLGTRADLPTQQTRVVALEPEIQDSSPPSNRAAESEAIPIPDR
ncbi:hypothetical protein Htur_4852 (plasmid) [Haloterrigena turkmenica DSM 5511]|uniref:DUF8112 domain-containing protein n=1 Tax=Haloterrigena turkmenica (strain ATCC 51198 / DSM 5511 / JCM 9101 / NCIMB 13204 / VKM B-1734 / 4k) TaxID=543526 RepID=D2S2L3_HALTV|nr:hypothetical protein [Haloterrigena turkmenica]ADB63610.1 hypothetical protein Htur_4852 [Haloterrigena turkmenica DSM 5511]